MKYQLIEQEVELDSSKSIRWLCQKLEVSASGYYDWLNWEPGLRVLKQQELDREMLAIHAEVKQRYGSPRMHQELLDRGFKCSLNTVAKSMKRLGIRSVTAKKYRIRTTDSRGNTRIAENLVNQDFKAKKANELWLGDITYIHTKEGTLFLAAIEDMWSRKIVGWSMDTHMESGLVVAALKMAVKNRKPKKGLVMHTDQGSQYSSDHYIGEIEKRGLVRSMSDAGDCFDNAPMESFWSTLKKEEVHTKEYRTRDEAKSSVFEYIESFYNRQRKHSKLSYRSPDEFESNELS